MVILSKLVRVQNIFYILGIFFLFSTISYFAYEYLFNLSNFVKTIILFALVSASFFGADYLGVRDI